MEKENLFTKKGIPSKKAKTNYFTGKVSAKDISAKIKPSTEKSQEIHFHFRAEFDALVCPRHHVEIFSSQFKPKPFLERQKKFVICCRLVSALRRGELRVFLLSPPPIGWTSGQISQTTLHFGDDLKSRQKF